jgi:hypothetical protein
MHRGRRLTSTVNEWCGHTGMSRPTAFRQMAEGRLRFVQSEPNAPRRIPFSEYARHGYDVPTDSDFIVIERNDTTDDTERLDEEEDARPP